MYIHSTENNKYNIHVNHVHVHVSVCSTENIFLKTILNLQWLHVYDSYYQNFHCVLSIELLPIAYQSLINCKQPTYTCTCTCDTCSYSKELSILNENQAC